MSPRSIRVLIAVRDPDRRIALTDLIARTPALALAGTASTADEALGFTERLAVDVALVDIDTDPGSDPDTPLDIGANGGGEQLIRALRRTSSRNGQTAVVASGASADRRDVVAMLRAGAIGYLTRESAAEEIVAAIANAADGRATVSPAAAHAVTAELVDHLSAQEQVLDEERARLARVRRVLDEELLEVVFQPIVSVNTGAVEGYEALARFSLEPIRPPNHWFAEAWQVGLGGELERLAVRVALSHLGAIEPPAYLAVNVSPELLVTGGLAAVVEAVDSTRVVVEMTEHAAVEDYDRLARAMAPLRAAGTRMSVDDTGAGFASLRHILRIQPDFIKLDNSITHHIDVDLAQLALARGLVSFAGDIHAHMIGEGVETNAELDILRELGFASVQGYLLGHPAPLRSRT